LKKTTGKPLPAIFSLSKSLRRSFLYDRNLLSEEVGIPPAAFGGCLSILSLPPFSF